MKRIDAQLGIVMLMLAACGDGHSGRTGLHADPQAAAPGAGVACSEPAEGCACDGDQPPVPCQPDSELRGSPALCYEGTRRCVAGVFGACEDVRAFAPPTPSAAALVDRTVTHPQCSDCDNSCFVVVDELSPDDGPLDASFSDGVVFHDSGAGITLEQGNPPPMLPPVTGLPPGSLFTEVPTGRTASAMHTHSYTAGPTDVYFLGSLAQSMAQQSQWLISRFRSGASYLDGRTRCVGGDQSVIAQGVAGAARCMIDGVQFGSGMYGDIPFEPYSTDSNLPVSEREPAARAATTFRHFVTLSDQLYAADALGCVEPTGTPETAGSQVPALYTIATGEGIYTGIDRRSVPAAPACDDPSAFGQPCFRDGVDHVVVMLGNAPMHNGPDPASYPYDYSAADLDMLLGPGPGAVAVPPTNESWDSAFHLSDDAATDLAVFTGSTRYMAPDLAGDAVGCGADDRGSDAVFTFDVVSPSGNSNVRFSMQGSTYPAALAVFSGPPAQIEVRASAGDVNELFTSAHDLGDVNGKVVRIPGDTTMPSASGDMGADYQGSLIGAACGASSSAPDAVYAFDVNSASAPVDLEVSADMGGNHAVVAVYEDTGIRRWPVTVSPLAAAGNTDAFPANVFSIPSGAGNEYVSITGSTSGLTADYNATDLGGLQCNPDSAAKDAAFQIHVDGTQTLRFDTEGSSFDTVLSLHDRPPLTNAGSSLRWPAADTHNNTNEDAASAYDVGDVNGRSQVFEGNTSGMRADITDTFGCGTQTNCGDAVYRVHVSERTALRIDVAGTGYEPGVVITRADPAGISGQYLPIATGGRHSCAISAGEVFCWGSDDSGQLGDGGGAGGSSTAAVRVSGVTHAQSICAGDSHSCAATEDGRVYCWGAGGNGRLGNNDVANQTAPVAVTDIGAGQALGAAAQVSCGDAFTCALLRDGRVACFGANNVNQIGDGTTGERRTPTLVSSAERFEQIESGERHSCAIRQSDNAVFCWGEGSYGKLGDGATSNNAVPARAGTFVGAKFVMAGGAHTCAALSSGRVQCWGRNNVGQLGQGGTDRNDHATPIVVRNADGSADLANVRGGMGAGDDHTCVATLEGYVMCWGANTNREIGHNSSSSPVTRPIGVTDLLDATQVVSGYEHTCAVRATGALACWGRNANGQLGNGNTATPPVPVASQPGSGGAAVSFGDGTVDAAFTQACRSVGEPPEDGCELKPFNGENYFFCDATQNARTWSGAAQACEQVGMRLAEVDAPGENAFIASQLEGTEQAWLGIKRETDDSWLNLGQDLNFENLDGERVWTTSRVNRSGSVVGSFTNAVASDLVSSVPGWTSSSTWASNEPSAGSGENCVTIDRNGDWRTERCSAVPPKKNCGFLGLGCLFDFLSDLVGGILDWIVPWVGDLTRVIFDSLAGRYAAPQFSGGVDHVYVCEEVPSTKDITLDPGDYYITVKGVDDGVSANACEGAYELTLTDLGTPGGGFLTCDDNGVAESSSSVIERTLTTGDYYLILKGKRPTDEGSYNLTVRDVGAVPSTTRACDAGLGIGDPALTTITAQPGHQYYALVKGDGPLDKGPFTLQIRDASFQVGTAALACDAMSGEGQLPELSLSLPTGSYYAVIKGRNEYASGDYQLTIGGASPDVGTFVPPTYDEAVDALTSNGIRVATVLSCDTADASCADAREQATLLAQDTGGAVRVATQPEDTPLEVVRVLEQVTAADRIAGELVFEPDANPGFTPYSVQAVPDPGNHCSLGSDGVSFVDCTPGATPAFLVTLQNPVLAPVAAATNALGLYELTLRVTTERAGDPMRVEDVPLFVRPSGAAAPGTYTSGEYFQDFQATGCDALNQEAMRRAMLPEDDEDYLPPAAPLTSSWDELHFDVDAQPDTSVTFLACGADSEAGLEMCDQAGRTQRVLTITGSDVPCTAATQATDCPDGYCSPYLNVCQYLEGASCDNDSQCPGRDMGRCRSGPSAATVGRTCRVYDVTGNPASALHAYNLPFVRMTLDLESTGDGTRTPSVFRWDARYHCTTRE